MAETPRPEAIEILAALRAAVLENTREVRGLRDDLGRMYGRDEHGRLCAAPPPNGGPSPVPRPAWTPKDVKDVLGRLFGEPERPTRRRR